MSNPTQTVNARQGEKPTVMTSLVPPAGETYTIVSGTFTLTSSSGAVVVGPTNVSGFDSGAQNSPRAWYLLDTTPLAAPSVYVALFRCVVTDSVTGLSQNIDADVEIVLALAYDAAYLPYDPVNTPISQVRFHAADTDLTCAYFSDAELQHCLNISSQNTLLAAAFALDKLAADDSRLAYVEKIEEYQLDRKELAKIIAQRAADLRAQVIQTPILNPPDQIFSSDSGNGLNVGTMSVW